MARMPRAYLIIAQPHGTAFIADRDKLATAQAQYRRDRPDVAGFLVLDLRDCHDRLMQLANGRREFRSDAIVTVSGAGYRTAHRWVELDIVHASIRGRNGTGNGREMLFSEWDLFVSATIGCAMRAGCGRATLRAISNLLYGLQAPQQEREPALS